MLVDEQSKVPGGYYLLDIWGMYPDITRTRQAGAVFCEPATRILDS